MEWDALVQRLWGVIESRGFEAFSARLRSALPDRSSETLTQSVQCLLASGNADVAQSLLSEFLSCHALAQRIKRRLQMLLMFEVRLASEGHAPAQDVESVMAEVQHLLDAHSIDAAISRILEALESGEDPDLLELLGRVHLLLYAAERNSENAPQNAVRSGTESRADTDGESADEADETDDLAFVWQETSLPEQQAHDEDCVAAAAAVQAIISTSTPRDPDAIEWQVEFDDEEDEVLSPEILDPMPAYSGTETSEAVEAPSTEDEQQKHSHPQYVSPPKLITSKRRSRLQQQEQQVFAFIQTHPDCSVTELATALELPIELAHYLVSTLQTDWLRMDRLGRLSIEQKLQPFTKEPVATNDGQACAVMASGAQADAQEPAVSSSEQAHPADIALKCATLPERSRRLLDYAIKNPGQKTHAAAAALGFSLPVVHALLNGALGEYLECTNFVVHPRPEVAAALTNAQSEHSHTVDVSQPSRAETPAAMPTPEKELPHEPEVSVADIARAARLSRLSPSSKKLLALLHQERQALSKDLAHKLGLESEQVNQALLGILSDHVTVRHSFWRLDERAIPALRLAGII